MIIREYTDRHNGKPRKRVERKCDECGKVESSSIYALRRGRERRGSDVDLCGGCSHLSKYTHMCSGSLHGNFEHGLSTSGYRRLTIRGERRYEHIVVMEKKVGRRLFPGESVHHVDFVKTNNSPENLFLFPSEKEHQIAHNSVVNSVIAYWGNGVWFDSKKKEYVLNEILGEFVSFDLSKFLDLQGKRYFSRSGKKRREYIVLRDERGFKTSIRLFHVFVMECFMGRRIYANEIVHHIDGCTTNNFISNLILMTKKEHRSCHSSLLRCAFEMIKVGKIVFDNQRGEYNAVECSIACDA